MALKRGQSGRPTFSSFDVSQHTTCSIGLVLTENPVVVDSCALNMTYRKHSNTAGECKCTSLKYEMKRKSDSDGIP
jgi:hypothetical protein